LVALDKSNIGEVHTENGLLKGRDTVTPTKILQYKVEIANAD